MLYKFSGMRTCFLGIIFLSSCKNSAIQPDSDSLSVSSETGQKKIFSVYRVDPSNTKSKNSQDERPLLWCAYEVENGTATIVNQKEWSIEPSQVRAYWTDVAGAALGAGGVMLVGGCFPAIFAPNPIGAVVCLSGATAFLVGAVASPALTTVSWNDPSTIQAWSAVSDIKTTTLNAKQYNALYRTLKNSGNTKSDCKQINYLDLKSQVEAAIEKGAKRP